MKKLKVQCKKNDTIIFESENPESVINWLITILFDSKVKRNKTKITQYYEKSEELCKIQGTYTDSDGQKIIYTVFGISNDWGNFINMKKTLIDNNIIIKGE